MDCSICLETPINKVTTTCNHIFCGDCLNKWLHIRSNCPLCRQPINIPTIPLPVIPSLSRYDENGNLRNRRQNYLDLYMDGHLEYENVLHLSV